MFYLERRIKDQKHYMWLQFRLCAINAAIVICFTIGGSIWGLLNLIAMLLNLSFITVYWKELGHMEQELVDYRCNTKKCEREQIRLKEIQNY